MDASSGIVENAKRPISPRRKAVYGILVSAYLIVAFAIQHFQVFAPFKDEHKYLENAEAWFSGSAMPNPAFSPIHALLPSLFPQGAQGMAIYVMNILLMLAAAGFATLIFRQVEQEDKRLSLWAGAAFFFFPPVVFAAFGQLAEPLALVGLLGALWAMGATKLSHGRALALIFFGALVASAARIDYFFYAIGMATALVIFGERRWLRLGVLVAGAFAGVALVAAIDAAFGAEFSLFRSHGAYGQVEAEPSFLFGRLISGVVDFAYVGWGFWFLPPLRWLGLAGIVVYARRRGIAQARPLLAMLLAGGMVFLMTDVSNITRGDGYLWRYMLLWLVPSAFGIVYLARIAVFWINKETKNDFVLLLLLLLLVPVIMMYTSLSELYPKEYLALKDFTDKNQMELSGKAMAQRTALENYIGGEVTHNYPKHLSEYSAQEFADMAKNESFDWIILQSRWEGSTPEKLAYWVVAGAPLITDYEVVTQLMPQFAPHHCVFVLKRRKSP